MFSLTFHQDEMFGDVFTVRLTRFVCSVVSLVAVLAEMAAGGVGMAPIFKLLTQSDLPKGKLLFLELIVINIIAPWGIVFS
jgi:hypothetical protein